MIVFISIRTVDEFKVFTLNRIPPLTQKMESKPHVGIFARPLAQRPLRIDRILEDVQMRLGLVSYANVSLLAIFAQNRGVQSEMGHAGLRRRFVSPDRAERKLITPVPVRLLQL